MFQTSKKPCEFRELIFPREIVGAKFIQPGFLNAALGIEEERPVTLDVKREMFRRDFGLRCDLEFERHKLRQRCCQRLAVQEIKRMKPLILLGKVHFDASTRKEVKVYFWRSRKND